MVKAKGFSTIEMLIAMTVLLLVLSAVVLLSFGNQSLLANAAAHVEALSLAEQVLDSEQALARKDFALVIPSTSTSMIGSMPYNISVDVETQSDYVTKKVTATVSWSGEYGRAQNVQLAVYLTNFESATSPNTCNAELAGNWSAPIVANTVQSFAQLVGDSSGTYTLTGLAVRFGKLYVTASNSSSGKETFFVFDTSTLNPTLLAKLDNDTKVNTGLMGVDIASSSAGSYAYVASASSFTRGQLQVINITNPAAPSIVATYKIPTTYVPSSGAGNTIFYKDGYVYLGLTKTSTGGKEFAIIDVHTPTAPTWAGGYAVGNDINSIFVNGSYAYIASPNAQNLLVLDVSNPSTPSLVGSYVPSGGSNGERVFTVGDTVYLGRTFGTNELYMLNASSLSSIASLGSKDLGVWSNTSINGIVVRSNTAFLLTNTQLVSYDTTNPAAINAFGTPLTLPNASSGAALTCEGNVLYAAVNDASNHGLLYLIRPGL